MPLGVEKVQAEHEPEDECDDENDSSDRLAESILIGKDRRTPLNLHVRRNRLRHVQG